MVQHLCKKFLVDAAEYESAQARWRQLWEGLVATDQLEAEWKVPWFVPEFVNGTPLRDGNPIFTAVSPTLRRGVRIIQHEPTTDQLELEYWVDKFHGDETISELVISCALSDQAEQQATDLLQSWITTGSVDGKEAAPAGPQESASSQKREERSMRVPEYLSEQQVPFETLVHPPAFTAQKRAKYLGVPGGSVAKGVLLAGPEGYLLAVLPATHHVDTQAVASALGGPVRIADAEEITKVFHDCERGVVEPFGSLYGLPTLLDDSIPADSWIVVEAHTHEADIRIHCRDFERLEKPRRLHFAHT